jgi:hypothetical protein
VATVTKRFVLRFTAPTKSYTIPNYVLFAVCRFYRDAAAYPERAVFLVRGRLNNDNRLLEFRLNSPSGGIVEDYQPPGRAVASFFDGCVPGLSLARQRMTSISGCCKLLRWLCPWPQDYRIVGQGPMFPLPVRRILREHIGVYCRLELAQGQK